MAEGAAPWACGNGRRGQPGRAAGTSPLPTPSARPPPPGLAGKASLSTWEIPDLLKATRGHVLPSVRHGRPWGPGVGCLRCWCQARTRGNGSNTHPVALGWGQVSGKMARALLFRSAPQHSQVRVLVRSCAVVGVAPVCKGSWRHLLALLLR